MNGKKRNLAEPSTVSAARFLAARKRREAATKAGQGPNRTDEVEYLRAILAQATGRFPRTALQLFAAVRAEYGTCGERRLWRVIYALVARGEIVRRDGGYVRAPQQQRSAA